MAVQFQDYYKILGVARSASQEEIQKAYRKQAKQYHPDVNKEKGAEDKFKKASEAYEVLKNPDSRKKYDALGSNWKAGDNFKSPPGWQGVQFDFGDLRGGGGGAQSGFGGGFSSFFDSIFGSTPGQHRRSQAWQDEPPVAKPAETEMILSLSPWEAALGTTLEVTTLSGRVKLKIPPGSQSGTRMRLKGKGQITRNGPGDLFLNLQIKVPSKLTVKEKDLFESLSKESKFNPRK
ncbi:MAG: DnaJ domain-containing protein [Myxococcota bacterium]